ncbi:PREDICTED: protein IQ-DOMAIN 31-like isoform X1 [Lupinus angustifolius]|uniref:protein IQ-DOMAIN 31-like isoform X1 n=1 Tax=Lupinus angustifolius TaxID=3871 RepID=UPI00092FA55D|nr:PREDICTED: protein IQ-DOMAIN 31-like isoform X1 [Lupinus angustifolius]XP_019456662.1 PREDICTED: protein IQ-DOMAIN 31-like isoform X1 [Lupinus angustifolius]XP_019456663.1 PREDICTED: protein IQ-DOMAIN 31-like isoform X1 [Lupinus angustifolius]XP_019456664.1 PREDICTED: protein IQ-DOMAIN 31-like isoform X1 [Lupinus angustifolius]XP_019456665.1 PREDICTED: protein IQ-DOMAIN 31-like isoform X1 [Lupinus angustifolius]
MGKGTSPGKWFKNLLLGKKPSSKSKSSKKGDMFKPSNNKDVLQSSELTVSDPIVDSLVISSPISGANAIKGVVSEKEVITRSSRDKDIISARDEETRAEAVASFGSHEDLEKLRLTEAAITVQSACRGYQARQTFKKLKGIIQLQALIHGHRVRRQAVSALYCVKGIVKLQALVRGYNVRHSDIGITVQKIRKDTKCSNSAGVVTTAQADKLSDSVFVRKLLASSSPAFPRCFRFDPAEPNMSKEWLYRWTRSHFWAPIPKLKKKLDSVSDENNGSCRVERGQVKRNTRKSPTIKAEDGSGSGSNKYKQRPKRDSNRPLLSAQEHLQKEIEKSSSVKTRVQTLSDRSEVNEKGKHSTRKNSDHTVTDVSKQGSSVSSGKVKDLAVTKSKDLAVSSASSEKMKDLTVSKSGESDPGKSVGQQVEDNHDNEPHNDPISVLKTGMMNGTDEGTRKISDHAATEVSKLDQSASSEKMKDLAVSKSKESDPDKSLGQQVEDKHDNDSIVNGRDEGIQGVSEDLNGADNCIRNNYQRRASLPGNFNDQDNESHNTPRLPSYMAPTESAKAKLRAQGSPRFASDLADKNSITRRHSLSSSLNGKSDSFSPRAERLVMSGRGVIRTDKSLSSSRDGNGIDKLMQPQWKR